jgi:hypothetical protein
VISVKEKGAGTDFLKGNLESASPTLLSPERPKLSSVNFVINFYNHVEINK